MFPSLTRPLLLGATALLLSACASPRYVPRQLQGTVSLPAKTTLPPAGTMLHLRLLNVSGSGGAASLLGELFINAPRTFPAPFALQYDQNAIRPEAHYQLDTQVFSTRALRLQDSTALPLAGGQLPARIDINTKAVGE
jgi:uncharacterized lipoprotein YbaY